MNKTSKLKILSLIVIVLTVLTGSLVGCKATPPKDPVNDLAEREKQWLTQLEPITKQIDTTYQTWTKGETDRKKFTVSLMDIHREFLKIEQDYQKHIKNTPLGQELIIKPVYKEGLINGKNLRADVNEFLIIATEGVENPQNKTRVPLNNSQLNFFYRQKMIIDYNIHIAALKEALKQYDENKDKTQ